MDTVMPKNILGMLLLAEDRENSLVFYKRWELQIVGKNDYAVFDLYTKEVIYSHVSLLISALHIIFNLNKPNELAGVADQHIYSLDQEYYRCMENIKFFKLKCKTKDPERLMLFSSRLQDCYYRLDDIKTRLSKIY